MLLTKLNSAMPMPTASQMMPWRKSRERELGCFGASGTLLVMASISSGGRG